MFAVYQFEENFFGVDGALKVGGMISLVALTDLEYLDASRSTRCTTLMAALQENHLGQKLLHD